MMLLKQRFDPVHTCLRVDNVAICSSVLPLCIPVSGVYYVVFEQRFFTVHTFHPNELF